MLHLTNAPAILSQSFNLRQTKTTKPTNTPGPATNVKVTAILEKANAIRQVHNNELPFLFLCSHYPAVFNTVWLTVKITCQAVGSDDGDDDDTWSDAWFSSQDVVVSMINNSLLASSSQGWWGCVIHMWIIVAVINCRGSLYLVMIISFDSLLNLCRLGELLRLSKR